MEGITFTVKRKTDWTEEDIEMFRELMSNSTSHLLIERVDGSICVFEEFKDGEVWEDIETDYEPTKELFNKKLK